MKKLILAIAIAASAAMVQAAAVTWSSSSAVYGPDGNKVGNKATAYIYAITAAQYADSAVTGWSVAGDDIMKNSAGNATASGKSNNMTSKISAFNVEGTSANTDYYYAVVITFGAGDEMKYVADKVTVKTGADGNATFTNVGQALYTAAGAQSAWTSAAAPEPTSGLLLLLGMAGLALRRRRA